MDFSSLTKAVLQLVSAAVGLVAVFGIIVTPETLAGIEKFVIAGVGIASSISAFLPSVQSLFGAKADAETAQ